jgi:hypothetical protein
MAARFPILLAGGPSPLPPIPRIIPGSQVVEGEDDRSAAEKIMSSDKGSDLIGK